MRPAVLLLAIAVVLSGCTTSGDSTMEDNDSMDLALADTWYLAQDGRLTGQAPEAAAFGLDWSLGEWSAGIMPPLWTGPAAIEPYVITSANVTITYRADANTAHSDTRPPFTIWFGAGDSIIEHAFAAGPNPFSEGDTQTITFPVDDLPAGGLVVEADEAPILYVGSYYGDGEDQGTVSILFGEAHSFVEWSGHTVELPEAMAVEAIDETIELQGGRCLAPLNPASTAQQEFTFEVTEDMVGIDVLVTRESGDGFGPDMDFFLLSPDGDDIAHAAGPSSPESVHLRLPNMEAVGPGTWTLGVYNCQPQAATYNVQLSTLAPL